MPDLVGRAAELAELVQVVDAPGARVAVVVGDAGIGKSTLLDAAVTHATRAGRTVLRCAPREPEAGLAFSSLTDLLDLPRVRELLAGDLLPTPQRTAVSCALLLADGDGASDERAVAAGVRELLRALATDSPLLVVVDDAQWLDPASELVLQHAVRRLADQPVSLLVGTRPTARPQAWPPGADGGVHRLTVTGLGEPELFQVVRAALGVSLPRGVLRSVTATSGGNPLYAVELVRASTTAGGRTDSLDRLVGATVRRLPDATRRVLLLAALAAEPSPRVLAAAGTTTEDEVRAALDEAAALDVAWWEGGLVRFRHPLLAAAAVDGASPTEVGAAHRSLADADEGAEARARHLARATTGPDPAVGDVVASAARTARGRGARAAAVELGQAALAVLPSADPATADLRLEVARWALRDGDLRLSRRLLAPLLELDAATAARAHLLLARAASYDAGPDTVRHHAETALSLAAERPLLQVEALLVLAEGVQEVSTALGQLATAKRLLDRATSHRTDSSDAPGDPEGQSRVEELLTAVLQAEGTLRLLTGDAAGLEPLRRAAERERPELPDDLVASATFNAAQQDLFAQRLEPAREALTHLLHVARDRGDELAQPTLSLNLAHLEIRAGRFAEAEAHAREALAVSEIAGTAATTVLATAQVTLLEAQRTADSSAAADRFAQIAAEADAIGDAWLRSIIGITAGREELQAGRPETAVTRMRAAKHLASAMGFGGWAWQPFPADLAEALVAVGDLEGARAELAELEARPTGLPRPHIEAVLPRVRAQLLAAEGDLDAAVSAADESVRATLALGSPFEAARSRLVAGRLLRRAKQKRRAHAELAAAAQAFDELGVPRLAARARDELARVGLRPSAPSDLTETEAQVADLAAAGRTNKEIAAAVFVSAKTVEGILGRVYRKLGVRSRVELARVRDEPPPPH